MRSQRLQMHVYWPCRHIYRLHRCSDSNALNGANVNVRQSLNVLFVGSVVVGVVAAVVEAV